MNAAATHPVTLWRIATDTVDYVASDSTGAGARKTGGRWNRVGTPMLYCSESIALACLETVVHLNAGSLPLNRYLVRVDVPPDLWLTVLQLTPEKYPGSDAIPYGWVSQQAGEDWIAEAPSVLLRVPSVIVPQEFNVLINPQHEDAARLTFHKSPARWMHNSRLR